MTAGTTWNGGWVNPRAGLNAANDRRFLPLSGVKPRLHDGPAGRLFCLLQSYSCNLCCILYCPSNTTTVWYKTLLVPIWLVHFLPMCFRTTHTETAVSGGAVQEAKLKGTKWLNLVPVLRNQWIGITAINVGLWNYMWQLIFNEYYICDYETQIIHVSTRVFCHWKGALISTTVSCPSLHTGLLHSSAPWTQAAGPLETPTHIYRHSRCDILKLTRLITSMPEVLGSNS